jgi:transcriptional regulator of acetoin/glycerol metabolism
VQTLSPNVNPTADPTFRRNQLRKAYERFVESGEVPSEIGRTIADSWRRCRNAGVDPERTLAPVQLTDEKLRSYRENHRLATVVPVLRKVLGSVAEDGRYLMAVTDADARLLWVEGHPVLRRRAERMNFVEGASWAETDAGTNAPGTAIAAKEPVQIFTAEHYSHIVQQWTCSAAPICDPITREVLGVVDITGGDHLESPASRALVHASALAAEGELLRQHLSSAPRDGTAAHEKLEGARLEVLGRDTGVLTLGTRRYHLTRRHSEILAILVQHPDGLTSEQLGLELYGEDAKSTTLRAEMVRLRRLLTREVVDSRPYRLRIPASVDFVEIQRLVREGSVAEALRRYRGPLLPQSQAPGIEDERRRVEQQVRAGLISTAHPMLLERWLRTPWGRDDRQLWQLLARTGHEPIRSIAVAEARRLAGPSAPPVMGQGRGDATAAFRRLHTQAGPGSPSRVPNRRR